MDHKNEQVWMQAQSEAVSLDTQSTVLVLMRRKNKTSQTKQIFQHLADVRTAALLALAVTQ